MIFIEICFLHGPTLYFHNFDSYKVINIEPIGSEHMILSLLLTNTIIYLLNQVSLISTFQLNGTQIDY